MPWWILIDCVHQTHARTLRRKRSKRGRCTAGACSTFEGGHTSHHRLMTRAGVRPLQPARPGRLCTSPLGRKAGADGHQRGSQWYHRTSRVHAPTILSSTGGEHAGIYANSILHRNVGHPAFLCCCRWEQAHNQDGDCRSGSRRRARRERKSRCSHKGLHLPANNVPHQGRLRHLR